MDEFRDSILALITETSTNLPPDVRRAMARAVETETGERSAQALGVITTNIEMACENVGPICQDTGWLTFEVHTPVGTNQIVLKRLIHEAVVEATKRGKLRENSVDSLTGANSGDNLGPGSPTIHFAQWEREEIEVKLLLKGGGCENKNIQYALPAELPHLGRAGRDLDGVRKCLLHAVWQAQGQGCSTGAIGVCIGGDRSSGYLHAKEQLFRSLDDTNPHPDLQRLEEYIMQMSNTLGIGTMGFGGGVTLIGCKVGVLNRLPASFFVSVAYSCWAFRRLGVVLDAESGGIKRWLYKDEQTAGSKQQTGESTQHSPNGFSLTGKEKILRAPVTEEQVRDLKVGDVVVISGEMYTGRDAVHAYLMKHEPPADLHGSVLYHCGPVVMKNGAYKITAAGPTTSIREEPYQGEIIKRYGVRAVIGKGGMGPKTLAALQEYGAVYLNAIGGAAQYYARCIDEVLDVNLLEFGIPEAMWHLRVHDFPAIVTMDAHGNSLHADIENSSAVLLERLAEPVFTK
ncbi:MAG: fumarate hydratase [Chloroflexota bacterium]|nr:fumarate hydratase [Chloroflexota bacterium]MDQ6906682.1 fumarate hydratase [Chloroflexota bacterium]